MTMKLFKSIFLPPSGSNIFCLTKKLPKDLSHVMYPLLGKAQFSDQTEDDRESKLKKLLNDSSPLKKRIEEEEEEGAWATSPYPEGTVFRELEPEKKKKFKKPVSGSIIMFPGQGNQFVGMATNLLKYPVVKDMFEVANDLLNYDLLKICQEGPEEKLNETEYCQVATLVCSLAALEILKDEKPWAIENCVGACGYSLGEYSALVFAGCLSFEAAVKLVKVRAEAMSICCEAVKGGMMTVLFDPKTKLSDALNDAVDYCKERGIEDPQCSVASYLFPDCKVIGGHVEALNFLKKNAKKYSFKAVSRLPVSGAFHTNLMRDAADVLKKYLQKVEINDPFVRIYSNVTGKTYKTGNHIRTMLPLQIYLPVKWEQVMHSVFERPKGQSFPFAYECGPGNSLTTILKKINLSASATSYAVKI